MYFAALAFVDVTQAPSWSVWPCCLKVFGEVAVNVKDDDAVSTDAGEDTYGFEVWVALDREGNVCRSELVVKGIFRGFAGSRATGLHASTLGVDGGVNESLRQVVDELVEVHVVFETSRTHPDLPSSSGKSGVFFILAYLDRMAIPRLLERQGVQLRRDNPRQKPIHEIYLQDFS